MGGAHAALTIHLGCRPRYRRPPIKVEHRFWCLRPAVAETCIDVSEFYNGCIHQVHHLQRRPAWRPSQFPTAIAPYRIIKGGHCWTVATHIEAIAPDEMRRRAAKFMQSANA